MLERRINRCPRADFNFTRYRVRGLLAGRVVWFYLGQTHLARQLVIYLSAVDDRRRRGWPQLLCALGGARGLGSRCWVRARALARPAGRGALLRWFAGSGARLRERVSVRLFLRRGSLPVRAQSRDHHRALPRSSRTLRGRLHGTPRAARVRRAASSWLATLGSLTWSHSRTFRDAGSLYEIDAGPESRLLPLPQQPGRPLALGAGRAGRSARAATGRVLQHQARLRRGAEQCGQPVAEGGHKPRRRSSTTRAALRIAPNNVATRTNLGIALYVSGRVAEAEAQYRGGAAHHARLRAGASQPRAGPRQGGPLD